MTVLHVMYLAMMPVSFELGTEVYRARVLNRHDKHFITVAIRFAIMLFGALTYNEVPWWATLAVMITFHYMCFNYLFNKYGLEKAHWGYLGNNLFDRLQKQINPLILLYIKITLFVLSVLVVLYS